jgi:hypothetical protein
MRVAGETNYVSVLENTFAKAQIAVPKDQQTVDGKEMTGFPGFLNKYYDDEGWWALAWIDAYDLTHERRYLAMAQSIFDDMAGGWDETCGGGIWWSKDRKYKNAIANELFLSVAAHLANRAGERARFDAWAAKEWRWFRGSGMINGENVINDGLRIDAATGACTNNGKTVWTYNQGVVLGGLAEWSKAGHADAIEEAKRIADAALAHLTDMAWIDPYRLPRALKVKIENQAQLIKLLIGTLPRLVLVLIVRVELHVFADREKTPEIDRSIAPFSVLALIEDLCARIRSRVIRANRHWSLRLNPVAIAPGEATARPVQVGPVLVGQQKSGRHRPASGCGRLQPVCCRPPVCRWQVAVSHR